MFLKTFIFLLTFVAGVVHSIHDPTYTGIKTKSYQRDPQIAKALQQQQQQQQQQQHQSSFTANQYQEYAAHNSYEPTQTINSDAIDEGLSQISSSNNNNNNNNSDNNNRYNTQYDNDDADDVVNSYQHELPIYDRNYQERHAASSNWDDAENVITEYYTGCPADYTGQLPYAYDCRRFLNCWKGRGHIQSCAPGTVFNPNNLECDRPDKVVCGAMDMLQQAAASTPLAPLRATKSTNYRSSRLMDEKVEHVPVLCPAGVSGLHPHPTDCTKFLNCANGNVHVQSCGPGTAYDVNMMVCDFIHKVDCSNRGEQGGQSGALTGAGAGGGHGYGNRPANYAKSQTNAVSSAAVVCPHDAVGLYPHPYDCTKYLNCANGVTYIQDCGPDTGFDNVNKVCDYKEKVHCANNIVEENDITNILCPAGENGLFAYPFDYKKYIECRYGNSAIQNCVPETIFSISRRFCETKSKVQTFDHVMYTLTEITFEYWQTLEICPPSMNGLHLYPYNCSKYISCHNGKMTILSCTPGTVFSLQRKTCQPEQQVETLDRVQNELEWKKISGTQNSEGRSYVQTQIVERIVLACPTPNGFYIYPFDCAKYFHCQNGNLMLKTCESGSVFNFARKHCDLRENVAENERVAFGSSYEDNFALQISNAATQSQTFTAVGYLTCPANTNGYYIYPFDCSAFISCLNGVTKLEYCASGSVFSISKKYCVIRDQVDAFDRVEYNAQASNEFSTTNAADINYSTNNRKISESGTVTCLHDAVGLYPHPYDCSKFLNCASGVTHVQDCGPGTAFDSVKKVCDFKEKVHCGISQEHDGDIGGGYENTNTYEIANQGFSHNNREGRKENNNSTILCPAGVNGLFAYPFDYTKYLDCRYGNTAIQNCVPDTIFSISKRFCESKSKVQSFDHVMYTFTDITYEYWRTVEFCPLSMNGLHLYPFDCSKYISCRNGQMRILSCTPGTVFSLQRKTCLSEQEIEIWDRVQKEMEWRRVSGSQNSQSGTYVQTQNTGGVVLVCPAPNGFYIYPFDCAKYFRCQDGNIILKTCESGSVFNFARKHCDLRENVPENERVAFGSSYEQNFALQTTNRNTQTTTFATMGYLTCPANVNGLYLHPFDCSAFIRCTYGVTKLEYCAPGSVFSISRKNCVLRDQVDAFDRVEYNTKSSNEFSSSNTEIDYSSNNRQSSESGTVTCPHDAVGLYPHPYDCSKFLNCASGVTHVQDCGPGTAFDSVKKVCDFKEKVHCGISQEHDGDISGGYENTNSYEISNQGFSHNNREGRKESNDNSTILCPAGVNGLFAYPFDYTKYLDCRYGNTAIQNCVPETIFSISKRFCESKSKVQSFDHVMYTFTDITYEYWRTVEFCPLSMNGLHLYPYDCSKYISCRNGQMRILSCTPGTVFSLQRKTCLSEQEIEIWDRVQKEMEWRRVSGSQNSQSGTYVQTQNSGGVVLVCPAPNGFYIYPFDCAKYFRCQDGNIILKTCESGSVFNFARKHCDLRENVPENERVAFGSSYEQNFALQTTNRNTQTTTFATMGYLTCPANVNGLYLHPFDCSAFIRCTYGVTKLEYCAPGSVFSISRKNCVLRDQVDAFDRVEYNTKTSNEFSSTAAATTTTTAMNAYPLYNEESIRCPRNFNGLMQHPTDCEKYIECANGQLTIETCAPGMVFSISKQTCDLPNNVGSTDRSSYARSNQEEINYFQDFSTNSYFTTTTTLTTENVVCPRGANGNHPHPYDSRKFLNCANGRTRVQICYPKMVFSNSRKTCDNEKNVDAADRGPYGTTTSGGNNNDASDYGQSTTSTSNIGLCPPGSNGVTFHPHDCTKFLNCANGVTHIMSCGPGTAWNNERQSCDFINKVNCTGRQAQLNQLAGGSRTSTQLNLFGNYDNSERFAVITCPADITGRFPHPFDCTKYINCMEGKKIIQNCIAGSVYSISKRFCELKEHVLSTDRVSFVHEYGHELMSETANGFSQTALSPEDLACPAGATGFYLHPFDPIRYLKCENERAVVYACVYGMVFSISRKNCFMRDQVDSADQVQSFTYAVGSNSASSWNSKYNSQITSSGGNLYTVTCPPGVSGLLPHPYDCKKYLNCSNGAIQILDCSSGTAWNTVTKLCDFEKKVDCRNRQAFGGETSTNVNTVTNNVVIKCPAGANGMYPHPFDCAKYIKCTNGVTDIQDCGPGTAWNSAMEVCDLINKVDCNGISFNPTTSSSSSSTSTTSSTTNTQIDYDYNHNNRDSKSYSNAGQHPNHWDHRPTGTNDQSWNNQQQQRQHGYDRNFQQPTSHHQTNYGSNTQQQGVDRWSNMNMQRPSPSGGYNPQTHYYNGNDYEGQHQENINWGGTAASRPGVVHNPAEHGWSGTGSSVHQQSPTQTVIYEEGSLQPNRNYPQVTRKYSTPLAPFSPSTPTTTTTTTTPSTIYYAQPVGSQENSEETFTNIAGGDLQPSRPTYQSNRPHSGRDFTPSGSWNPPNTYAPQPQPLPHIYKPNQNLTPSYPYNTQQNLPLYPEQRQPTDNTVSETVNIPVTRLMPPQREYVQRQYPQEESDAAPNVTNINMDNLPGIPFVYNLSNPYGGPQAHFGTPAQTPPGQNRVQEVDETNLYGGLQPPHHTSTQSTTTPNPYIRPPSHPTIPTQSSSNDSNEPESRAHVYQIYPPIKTAQMFPREPHYSSPYSGVAHSHNASWPNTGIKSPPPSPPQPPLPRSHIKTSSTPNTQQFGNYNPANQYATNSDTAPTANYNRQYYKPAITRTDTETNDPAIEQLPISQALRMLLRPYFNRSGTVDDDIAAQAESHIMNLASKSKSYINPHPTTTTTTTTTTSTTTTTKRPNAFDMDGNEKDVELIFAGEQHSLVEVPTRSGGTTDKVHTNFHATEHNWQNRDQGNTHKSPHEHPNNWHNPEYHQRHPNLPNPFNGNERSSSANPHRNWLHNQHNPHHHNNHHEHSREFHMRHPNIPNPFETTTAATTTTTIDDSEFIPNPWAESTTPKTAYLDFDVRGGATDNNECQFNCGNGKCIKETQLCDGVNDCGDRKDESQCDHLGYEVRLAGGDATNLGRIEVKVLGKWGYVCDDKFGLRDADVVCKELGFELGASEVRGNSFWAPKETNISFVMDEVDCEGNERSLKECNHKGWGVNNCGVDEIVGVVCKVPLLKCPNNYWLCSTSKECIPPAFVCDNTPDCADQSDESDKVCNSPIAYRLEGGRSLNEGRLEVMYRGEWGTVCDDDFGQNEAKVLCYSLGFYGTPKIEKNIYGPGNGPIWLDQVSCLGNETSLDKCNHWTWGEHNCNHTEDVGIKCTVGPPPRKNPTTVNSGSNANANTQQSEEELATTLEDIGVYSGQWQRSSKHLPDMNQKRCGHYKNNIIDEYEHPEERVVNGTAAKRGHHPWQATIRTKGRGGISSHWCGAVLISKKHLLTAAHCLVGYPKGAYFIRLGDHYANIAEASETDSYIENWYIHEQFRDRTHMNNDIALIVLKHPVRFNDYIQPICLPEKGATLQVNRMCTISGWGSIKSGVSTPSNILRAAQLPILSDETCKQPHVYGNSMTEGMFCAGSMDESVDACDGDSGGPLVCSDEDGETLYGIISWGQQCGFANKPGVYVRVEKYIDWIYEKINFSLQGGN